MAPETAPARDGAPRPIDALLQERFTPGPWDRGPARVERLVRTAIDEVSRDRGVILDDAERANLARHVTTRLDLAGLLA